MSTQMALVTGSSMPASPPKPSAAKSAPVFGVQMQKALALAVGTAVPQKGGAAGHAVVAPEAVLGNGQLEGFAAADDLLSALGVASPLAAGQPAVTGVQPFLPETMVDGPVPGDAEAAPGMQLAAETQAPALGTGTFASGTAPGATVVAAHTAAVAAETEGPTPALLPQGVQQGATEGGRARSAVAGIPAPAPGTSATGTTAVLAQQRSLATQTTGAQAPGGDAQAGAAPAQLFAVAAGQQPPAASPVQAAPASLSAAAASPPLNTQLQGPLFSLVSAKPGEHTVTLSVTPDNLGPVTVRAQIGTDGIRVELFAPNDAGREALRAILQDLKRDLASAGLGAELDLSSENHPEEQGEDGPDRRANAANQEGTAGRQLTGPGHHAEPYLRLGGSETGLDVLA